MRYAPLFLALSLTAISPASVPAAPEAEICAELPTPHRADCEAAYDLLTSGPLPEAVDLTVRPLAEADALVHRYDVTSRAASVDECAVEDPLLLPAGAKVRLIVTSGDTIYRWEVPDLGIAADLLPGRVSEITLETDAPGLHEGMLLRHGAPEGSPSAVEIVVPQQFEAWYHGILPGLCGAPDHPRPDRDGR